MRVPSLRQKDPLEEGMATHSSILTWRIPVFSPGESHGQRILAATFIGSQRLGHN